MRRYIILFALCIFFAGIGYYLLNSLNPFDETQIAQLVHSENLKVSEEFDEVITELINKGLISEFLNVRNVVLLSSTILLSVLSGFMLLHVAIDKLFFRKFYEQPSIAIALRRGIFVCVGLVSIFIYKLYAAEWYLSVLTLGLLLIVELVIGRLVDNQKPVEVAPVLEIKEASGEESTESDTEHLPAPTPKKRSWKFQLPNLRELPSRFKQRVMQDIAESETEPDSPLTPPDEEAN